MNWIPFRGFSLVELLVVILLLALVATIAVPSYGALVERNRALALADQLQSQLAHARFVSVVRNRDVEVCGSSDGRRCDGSWNSGWILHVPNNDGELLSGHRLNQQQLLRWRGFSKAVRFRGNGTAPLGNGSFYICDSRTKEAVWQLTVNRQGRVRREPGAKGEAGCG